MKKLLRLRGKACAWHPIRSLFTSILPTTSWPCSGPTRRGRSSARRRGRNWMISYSTVLSTLLPFRGRTRMQWGKSQETGGIWQAVAAQREAGYGNHAEARQLAAEALKLAPTSRSVESEAALAFAVAGDLARAESLALDLGKRFPLDTQMQSLWLPAIRVQLALDRKNSPSALNALQAGPPIELGQIGFVVNISCLYPTYVRGEAYLAAGQGSAAAAEFQKIIDQLDRLELLDGSVGTSGSGSGECLGVENFAWRGCRCRPRPGARCLQGLPHALGRRRPRHSDSERSQGRVRDAAVAGTALFLRAYYLPIVVMRHASRVTPHSFGSWWIASSYIAPYSKYCAAGSSQ